MGVPNSNTVMIGLQNLPYATGLAGFSVGHVAGSPFEGLGLEHGLASHIDNAYRELFEKTAWGQHSCSLFSLLQHREDLQISAVP